jgi:hypothetical protein
MSENPSSVADVPVRDHHVHAMTVRRERSQLHLLCVLDLLCITVAPLERHFAVLVCIYKDVECAFVFEQWQVSDRTCDLAEE